jgi:hypothetical protein
MCLNIFIGSEKELPVVPWNEENPGFCLDKLSDEKFIEIIAPILNSNYYYDVGSFMGCSCGFSFGKWSKETNDNHEQRIANIQEFKEYLSKYLTDNIIKLFCTYWESFPEIYPIMTFMVSSLISDEFDFEEDVILLVE